ncbi:N-acetylmuramoyl-L-alanine amidase (AmiC) (PDB:1JWQ) [Commensalibacter communis]|uniref:N-acetylmuramoyl-L-alanine amidase n=1 Tax=Commensalibacter communis TaxID=2972786 RepID=A0A9W4TMX9_9PROT|nr:N-acetylmuramoyl-L-alanine amidase [Commensalibacter communis]CAI3925516.1 N-acetylmuramoyl-L-alanine amidase (AmiC) (PDB:1JWQ) [Commensalibacter communis]CAI3927044.1 N-acetylmuramoyl-L-alanine amidase (AmiC) (PDB:1JWQ) [Commensalibacter communis]CAI3935445.1 N-acetylmuramoyl-L-alanine amidase (AmiC) (PDB:1JWQ) [Commensalibacter communis]CAI3935971.1 N-acetylmuramoyl-L-alanine amidase (AmiC) (PDB:1JWQ) [Commensalibacter communis]
MIDNLKNCNEIIKDSIPQISRRIILSASVTLFVPSVAIAVDRVSQKSTITKHVKTSTKQTVKSKAPAIVGRARPHVPVIILDPGHGGKDPGAVGYSGTYEKHVAYATAVELSKQLMRTGKYRVKLTRNSDKFVPLDGRVDFAQSNKANLFVSMHADALNNHSIRGASVYTLSNHASDAQSAALASVENNADRYGGANVHVASPAVQKILASLVKLETKKESVAMARNIVSSFHSRVSLLQNPKRYAAFVVLKSINIPSILVEMGFMSNRVDEEALKRAAYRSLIASSMCQAIDRYFAIGGSVTHLTG